MKKRLFLSGRIGCGKTTLIRNALGEWTKYAGGFVTERAFDKNGLLIGFDMIPACSTTCLDRCCYASRFLTFSNDETQRKDDVFRLEAVRLLTEALTKPFALLDEFGGFELLVPEFYRALMAFLKSDVPCVGVIIKSLSASEALRSSACLPPEFTVIATRLHTVLKTDGDTEILETSGRGDREAEVTLQAWVKEYANAK
ncbi:MAG: nucleoside-triphosphatase [Candidatus Fimivivens sp.]|nr:nucleoside-triphosphatase [Candidatus Fimivivens sp.]